MARQGVAAANIEQAVDRTVPLLFDAEYDADAG
jgi:hypothetical protein